METLSREVQGLSDIQRETLRLAASQRLKENGFTGATKLIDSALRFRGRGDKLSGPVPFPKIKPWPDPVDGAQLFDRIRTWFHKYLILPHGASRTLALGVAHSHALDAAETSPIFNIYSPTPRCGKTLALTLFYLLARRPILASNISKAVIYRVIEKYQVTLCIDESDTFFKGDDILRGILNSGHRRASALTWRCDGDDHDVRSFSTWGVKAVAGIIQLQGTLRDRSIPIRFSRKRSHERVAAFRYKIAEVEAKPLREMLARWAKDNLAAIGTVEPEIPAGLNDRQEDNWHPLLSIAHIVGKDWTKWARESCRLLSIHTQEEEGPAVQLLEDLHQVLESAGKDKISSSELVQRLAEMEDRPWPEWRNAKPITAWHMARILSRFDIVPTQFWTHGKKKRGYVVNATMEDAFSRYLERGQPGECVEATPSPTDLPSGQWIDPVGDEPTLDPYQSSLLMQSNLNPTGLPVQGKTARKESTRSDELPF